MKMKKVIYTAETLMVQPLDAEKFLKLVEETLPPLPDNAQFTASPYEAFINGPVLCNVDTDCRYRLDFPRSFHDSIIQHVVTIPVGIKTQKGGATTRTFNKFDFTVGWTSQLTKMLKPAVSLKEFMDTRYNYNPRIISNTREFLADYNNLYASCPRVTSDKGDVSIILPPGPNDY